MTSNSRPYLDIDVSTSEKMKALQTSVLITSDTHVDTHIHQPSKNENGIEGLNFDFSEHKNCYWEDMVWNAKWGQHKPATQLPIHEYESLCCYHLPDGSDQFASEDMIDDKQVLRDLKYLAFGFASAVFKGDKESCTFSLRKPCRLKGRSVTQTTSLLREMCDAGAHVVMIEQFISRHLSTNEKVGLDFSF